MSKLTRRNAAGLVRWARWRGRYHSLGRALFFCGPYSRLELGAGATFNVGKHFVALENFHAVILGAVRIGNNVFFNESCHVSIVEGLTIGDGCLFGEKVSIHDEDHLFGEIMVDVPLPERGVRSAPIAIGNDVWVGAKASILSGVSIGDGAVIGAHAVVTRDVPARSLAVGSPAKVIRSW